VTEKKAIVSEGRPAPKKKQAVSKHKKIYAKRTAVREKINAGDYRGAIKILNAVIAKNPDESINYRLRGNAFDNLGNQKRAIEDWKKAAALGDTIIQSYLRFLEIDWQGETP
jgi:Flp pilus assembly protein TadD